MIVVLKVGYINIDRQETIHHSPNYNAVSFYIEFWYKLEELEIRTMKLHNILIYQQNIKTMNVILHESITLLKKL